MKMLFDIYPEEPQRSRPRRAQKVDGPKKPKAEEPKKPLLYREKALRPIGKLDGIHECLDQNCQAQAHDILHEDRGEWLIQCCFCHTAQWVPVIAGHLSPRQEGFVFRDGRFAGMPIDEAATHPRGVDYIQWAAKEHDRPAVRAACEIWLANRKSSL